MWREIAKLYAGQGVLLEDLVGEGNLALSFGVTMLGSLEKPEEVEGMLGKMIMDAMEEYIAEHAENSKIDKRVEDKVNKVADKARELAEELQRKVTIEELMEETGMSLRIHSPNGQPYIQRNFIRYGRKPILQKTCRE